MGDMLLRALSLREILPSQERTYLENQGHDCQFGDALQTLARMSHHMTSFILRAINNSDSWALQAARERIAHLESFLEEEKALGIDINNRLDLAEELLQDARETVDRREAELYEARQRIQDLERHQPGVISGHRRSGDLPAYPGGIQGGQEGIPMLEVSGFPRPRSPEGLPRRGESSEPRNAHRSESRSELRRKVNLLRGELDFERNKSDSFQRRASRSERELLKERRREEDLVKKGEIALQQACNVSFSAGFERCKKVLEPLLPRGSLARLQPDHRDECLKAVTEDSLGKFLKAMATDTLGQESDQ